MTASFHGKLVNTSRLRFVCLLIIHYTLLKYWIILIKIMRQCLLTFQLNNLRVDHEKCIVAYNRNVWGKL